MLSHRLNKYITAVFLWSTAFLLGHTLLAQDTAPADTTAPTENVSKVRSGDEKRARKAMFYSMACPGLGQIYNGRKQYWKVPILYGGAGFLAYTWITNAQGYRTFKRETETFEAAEEAGNTYIYFDDKTGLYYTSSAQTKVERDSYHRYRDLSIILCGALYGLQIMDAYVFAHLKTFDVSDDLSMQVKPVFFSNYNTTFAGGVGLTFSFK